MVNATDRVAPSDRVSRRPERVRRDRAPPSIASSSLMGASPGSRDVEDEGGGARTPGSMATRTASKGKPMVTYV